MFWTRTSKLFNGLAAMTDAQLEAHHGEIDAELTPKEIEVMRRLNEVRGLGGYGNDG